MIPMRPGAALLGGAVPPDARVRPNPLVPISAAGGQMGSQVAATAAQAPGQDSRARLAQAILNATGGGQPQEVQHPLQAAGNAMQQIAQARLQQQAARQAAGPSSGPFRPTRPRMQMIRPGAGQYRRPAFKPGG